jgi:single-strand DNA-binding protein
MNSINLIGRLGKDPDVRYLDDGKVVGKASIAVKRWGEGADWFDLEVWGKQAQTLADYCRKGDQIGIGGRMTQEEWTDRNSGEVRKRWLVKVNNLELLSKSTESPRPAAQAAVPLQQSANWGEDEVPF